MIIFTQFFSIDRYTIKRFFKYSRGTLEQLRQLAYKAQFNKFKCYYGLVSNICHNHKLYTYIVCPVFVGIRTM